MLITPAQLAHLKAYVIDGFTKSPKDWWFQGQIRDGENGWPEVFLSANYHCVYCRKNLSATLDDLASSTTDHLVPQRLFKDADGNFIQSPNWMSNLVPCCSVCNTLKSSWQPDLGSPAWNTRKAYIAAVRNYIADRREERKAEWRDHFDKAQVIIWQPGIHDDFLP